MKRVGRLFSVRSAGTRFRRSAASAGNPTLERRVSADVNAPCQLVINALIQLYPEPSCGQWPQHVRRSVGPSAGACGSGQRFDYYDAALSKMESSRPRATSCAVSRGLQDCQYKFGGPARLLDHRTSGRFCMSLNSLSSQVAYTAFVPSSSTHCPPLTYITVTPGSANKFASHKRCLKGAHSI